MLENKFELMSHLVDGSCLPIAELPSDLAHVMDPNEIFDFFKLDAGKSVVLFANDLVPAANGPVSDANGLVLAANDPVLAQAPTPAPGPISAPEFVPTLRKTFKCMLCKKIFPDPNNLYIHFKNKVCFSPKSHQYAALREQYDIPIASKYSPTAMLQVALWEDLSANPKQCPCCAKMFATSAATSGHVRAMRGMCQRKAEKKKSITQEAKRWKCREENCGAETEGRRAMVEHLEKEHGDVRKVRCVYCGWLFETERQLADHEEMEEGCVW
jgi:hypothetical protein